MCYSYMFDWHYIVNLRWFTACGKVGLLLYNAAIYIVSCSIIYLLLARVAQFASCYR